MPINKEIIIRVAVGFIFFIIFFKVVGPAIYEILKGKLSGTNESDIDTMIRRQKEKLRAQYGINHIEKNRQESTNQDQINSKGTPPATKEIAAIYKETRWGGGEFAKNIQTEIAKNYSHTLAETKVNSFILLAEKRNYLRFLSLDNQKSPEAIKNYLSLVMLTLILVEEIRTKEIYLLERVAKKCHVSPQVLAIALQLKILYAVQSKREVKEDRLFSDVPVLHQFSEETMKEAFDTILKKEANLWTKGHSLYFEELALYLSYADILSPYPKLQSKNDLDTAYSILKVTSDDDLDDIKKAYKKLAMAGHPDKVGQMKLPKIIEKKAMNKFNSVQEAYEVINAHRKK